MFTGCIPHQVAPVPLEQPALRLWVLTTEPKPATQLAETSQPTWAGSRSEQAGRRFGYSVEGPTVVRAVILGPRKAIKGC